MSPLVMTALLLAAPPRAGVEDTMHRSPHTEHTSWLVGVKAVQLSAFPAEGESLFGGGVGLFAERTLIEGWLELEASASYVEIGEGYTLPVDLLFKKPWHLGHGICPYFGVGPTLAYTREEGRDLVGIGGAAVAGVYVWFGDHFGIDLEVDYAVLDEEGAQHEITVAGGPTLRF